MRSRKVWILVGCLVGSFVLLVGVAAVLVVRYVAPAVSPLLNVRSEIVQPYPSSNPSVNIVWQNGRKTFNVSVAASFNPMQDSAAAQDMADRVAEIVREHYDLAGYSGISVSVEQRMSAGVVHAKTARSFSFPTAAPVAQP